MADIIDSSGSKSVCITAQEGKLHTRIALVFSAESLCGHDRGKELWSHDTVRGSF